MAETHRRPGRRAGLADASPDSLLVVDEKGVIRRISGNATNMLGRAASELQGLSISDVLAGDSAARLIERLPALVGAGPKAPAVVLEGVLAGRPDGSEIPVEAVLVALDTALEESGEVLVTLRDDTASAAGRSMKRQERERLESSNRDLEAFASLAAHDLQEPLRKIRMFADRAKIAVESDRPEDALAGLDRVEAAADRLQALITDLLGLARVSGQVPSRDIVDIAALIESIGRELVDRTGDDAEIEFGAIPPVEGDPVLMRQLFHNLISNALKFRRPGVPAKVRVSGEEAGEWVVVSVADNGIGFDDKYAERIFRPFQRLHSPAEYEGSGVGLAMVEAIVERHGGEISAHGQPGEGATFTLNLPAVSEG